MNIEKQAQDWVNDGDWGYPVDATGQWMFDKLVEAYKAGYEAATEQLQIHSVSGSVCDKCNGLRAVPSFGTFIPCDKCNK